MRAIRKINNNAAICVDGKGRELVVLGTGVGFGDLPRDIPLTQIDRTFYGVDPKYLGLIGELSSEVLEFAGQLTDLARNTLSYELSPNLPITLADHIAFAIKRAQEHMIVSMPLSYDVQQSYPLEFRLGEMAVKGMSRTFNVRLPRNEATGIALALVNSAVSASVKDMRDERKVEVILEQATRIVEEDLDVEVNRDSFDFARFATHMRYLIDRVSQGEPIATKNSELYPVLAREYPQVTACSDRVAALIGARFGGVELTEEERVYLILHITRVSERAGVEGAADAV